MNLSIFVTYSVDQTNDWKTEEEKELNNIN
jgi:hypothetical protein